MRSTVSSTGCSPREPLSLQLPGYALAGPEAQERMLDELVALVVTLDRPAQVWHGPARYLPPVVAPGAAGELTTELVTKAWPRRTDLYAEALASPLLDGDTTGSELLPLPDVTSESRGSLALADGRVGAVLALIRWPATVGPDWLAEVAAPRACAAIALHLRPVAEPVAARLLRRRLASLLSTVGVDEQAGRVADPSLGAAVEAAEGLWDQLVRGETTLLHAQLLVGLVADDRAGLASAVADVRRLLGAVLAEASVLTFGQRPGWVALAPGAGPAPWPWRLLDAASVAATIPHPVGPPAIADGVLTGVEAASGAPIRLDRFAAHNPARLVVGTSGAGKSYAAKVELTRQLAAGARAVVVDPEGEFTRLGEALGGLVLAVGEEPAGLDPVGLALRPALAPAEGLAVLASFATALLGGPLVPADLALLDRALGVLRADPASSPSTADLVAIVADLAAHPPYAGNDLAARLAPAAEGSLASLFAPNPALADPPPLVVFDLRAVPARVRPAVMACVLAWSWARATDGGGRQLVVVDEAHLLLDDLPAAELLAQFARRARKYGVALDVVTQRLSDFLCHPTGEAVLANAATKLLLPCEDHERVAVQAGLDLSDREAVMLRPALRGCGLLLAPGQRIPLMVVAHPAEHELASSGPRPR